MIILFIMLFPLYSFAQFNGHNTLGDYGVQAGTQADPGFYSSIFYYRYDVDKIIDSDGNRLVNTFEPDGDIALNALSGIFWYVSKLKILGANYSSMAVLSFSNSMFEAPILGISNSSNLRITDLYIQPINLGWKTERADYLAGIGLFAPTGEYELGGDNNGLGMWSLELFGGLTYYFNKSKTWHFAVTGWYEIHSNKKDSELKMGDILTIEGALGKTLNQGMLLLGISYYLQWKLTADNLSGVESLPLTDIMLEKHKRFGVGPDITYPLIANNKQIAFLNVRYFWEFGSVMTTQGNTFNLTATFPIPSIGLE